MDTKQKALTTTIALVFISAILSYVSWTYGAYQEGLLGTVFGALTFLFAVMAVVAIVSAVTIGRTSSEQMENRKKKKKRGKGASRTAPQSGTALHIPGADFDPTPDQAPSPSAAATGPRPVSKGPRPVSKGPRPVKKT